MWLGWMIQQAAYVCSRGYVPVMGGCTLLVHGVTADHSGCVYFRGGMSHVSCVLGGVIDRTTHSQASGSGFLLNVHTSARDEHRSGNQSGLGPGMSQTVNGAIDIEFSWNITRRV